jgi:hypothetical protein
MLLLNSKVLIVSTCSQAFNSLHIRLPRPQTPILLALLSHRLSLSLNKTGKNLEMYGLKARDYLIFQIWRLVISPNWKQMDLEILVQAILTMDCYLIVMTLIRYGLKLKMEEAWIKTLVLSDLSETSSNSNLDLLFPWEVPQASTRILFLLFNLANLLEPPFKPPLPLETSIKPPHSSSIRPISTLLSQLQLPLAWICSSLSSLSSTISNNSSNSWMVLVNNNTGVHILSNSKMLSTSWNHRDHL